MKKQSVQQQYKPHQVFTNSIFTKGVEIEAETIALNAEVLKLVDEKIGQ